MKYGDATRKERQRGSVKILIYVIFRATFHECLSVSNISEPSSRKFSETLRGDGRGRYDITVIYTGGVGVCD